MAVQLTSQFPPESDPFAADSAQAAQAATLVAVVERLTVVEQSVAALTIELNRIIDEATYLRLKIDLAEGDHR